MILAATLALLTQSPDPLLGTWTYRATAADGKLVATGSLNLHRPTPEETRRFRLPKSVTYFGTKDIRAADQVKYGPHGAIPGLPGPQSISGTRTGKEVRLDLNQGWADNNVVLTGMLKGKRIEGTWGWSTFAGVRVHGKFTLTRKN